MINTWVEKEMASLNIGDERLNKRTMKVLQTIMDKPSMAFPNQFQSTAELKACYRFFDSDLVTSEKILEPHFESTIKRIKMCTAVIIASDSTSLNYTSRESNQDSGYISSNNAQGFFLHASYATTLDRQPLGVVGTKFWARDKKKAESKVHRDYLPIEEKESYKWIESYAIANSIASENPNTQIINVCDREADLIELFEEAIESHKKGNAAHLIVRCKHNRAIIPTRLNKNTKLFEFGKNAPLLGHCQFDLKDRTTLSKIRTVRQEVRATSIRIHSAQDSGRANRELLLNLLIMREINPPDGVEPVVWHLLTTLPIDTYDDTQKIVQAYLARWDIEVFFRTFKTGCKVEERSLRTADRLYPMFTLFLIVAWRINSLSRISRINPELPCTVVFSEKEWKAAYAAITKSARSSPSTPTIREMLVIVARLGGYLNRKNDPEPGAKVIWRGLEYLRTFMEAWEIIQSSTNAQDEFSVKKSYG